MQILEALEVVGEEEMLKRLEESIMMGKVPNCSQKCAHHRGGSAAGSSAAAQGPTTDHQFPPLGRQENTLLARPNAPLVTNTPTSPLRIMNLNTTSTILKQPLRPPSTTRTLGAPGSPVYRHQSPTTAGPPDIVRRSTSSEPARDAASVRSGSNGRDITLELPPAMPPPRPPPRMEGSPTHIASGGSSGGGTPTPSSLFRLQLGLSDPSIPYITSPTPSHGRLQ
ncbi:hypothetical protein AAVH_40510, partial [Aphelenchoides avenae]